MRDPIERDAIVAQLERDRESEGTAHLPGPVLYPIRASQPPQSPDDDDSDKVPDIVFDEYDTGGSSSRREKRDPGPDIDDEGRVCTGIPAFPLIMWVDIQVGATP